MSTISRAPPVVGLLSALLPEVLVLGGLTMADTVVPKGKAPRRAASSAAGLEKMPVVKGLLESARATEMAAEIDQQSRSTATTRVHSRTACSQITLSLLLIVY